MKDIENSVKKILASYSKKGIEVKEIWYEAELRVGTVIRYSLNGTIKEMQIPVDKDIAEIITPYQKKTGIVIKIETVPAIQLTIVLSSL